MCGSCDPRDWNEWTVPVECAEILCKSEGAFAFTLLGGLASPARLTCLRHMSRIHIHTPRCDLDGTFVSRLFSERAGRLMVGMSADLINKFP